MDVSRAWVSFGLLLSRHPRFRRRLDPANVRVEGLLAPSAEMLGRALSLRSEDATDIFSGAFPAWADREIEAARGAGVSLLTYEDVGYPEGLRKLPDPPPFLYVRGDPSRLGAAAVAVVGSRRASPYGLQVAGRLCRDLAEAGVTVVSGMARGVDTAAHRGALEGGGPTIGVLGSGIDVVYPPENAPLYARMAASGTVVTEFPFRSPPHAQHFPIRNRIIAALSGAVVVVEAARDSGSLITARLAADALGLPVCAVPGPITARTSEGCNDLIYDGATPVRSARDVIDLLPDATRGEAAASGYRGGAGRGPAASGDAPAGDAGRLLEALSPHSPRSADELAGEIGLAPAALLGHLLDLEMRGLAAQLPGGLYVKKI